MEQIRSFIAIEMPDNIKRHLKTIQENIKSTDPSSSKWVNPDNIHLTLKFLGNVPSKNIDSICRTLKNTLKDKQPFILTLGNTGVFPSKKRVRVIWVGLNGDTAQLNRVYQDIDSNLSSLGFESEQRQFSPHLTLARVYDNITPERKSRLGEAVYDVAVPENELFKVDSFILFKSVLTKFGPVYTKLKSFMF